MPDSPNTPCLPNAVPLLAGSLAALGSLVPVALYQFGFISRLPDPPGRFFDSERITRSKSAHIFGVPDSLPGFASYGVTLGLILAARRHPGLRRWLAAKLTMDGAIAATKAAGQIVTFGRLCSWCLLTTASTVAMVCAGRGLLADSALEAARGAVHALHLDGEENAEEPVLDALSPHA